MLEDGATVEGPLEISKDATLTAVFDLIETPEAEETPKEPSEPQPEQPQP